MLLNCPVVVVVVDVGWGCLWLFPVVSAAIFFSNTKPGAHPTRENTTPDTMRCPYRCGAVSVRARLVVVALLVYELRLVVSGVHG